MDCTGWRGWEVLGADLKRLWRLEKVGGKGEVFWASVNARKDATKSSGMSYVGMRQKDAVSKGELCEFGGLQASQTSVNP